LLCSATTKGLLKHSTLFLFLPNASRKAGKEEKGPREHNSNPTNDGDGDCSDLNLAYAVGQLPSNIENLWIGVLVRIHMLSVYKCIHTDKREKKQNQNIPV